MKWSKTQLGILRCIFKEDRLSASAMGAEFNENRFFCESTTGERSNMLCRTIALPPQISFMSTLWNTRQLSIYESLEVKGSYKQTVTLNKAQMHGHSLISKSPNVLGWGHFFHSFLRMSFQKNRILKEKEYLDSKILTESFEDINQSFHLSQKTKLIKLQIK